MRLPRPEQLEVRRIWEKRPCLGVPGNVVVEVRNGGRMSICARIVDETPTQLRSEPPDLDLRVEAGATAQARYVGMPAGRGGTRVGGLFLRFQSPFGLAQRWGVAETPQNDSVP